MTLRLANRRALVVGGARGIGRAIAIGLAEAGSAVAIGDLGGAPETVREIEARGGRALSVPLDVTEPAAVEAAVREAAGALDGLDILVQCAGIIARTPFLDVSLEEWQRVLEVNLTGSFLVGQAVARQMVERRSGSIIFIASVAIQNTVPGQVAYQVSKAGVAMLTRAMALDLAPYGVRVNAIAPGLTETDLSRPVFADPVRREKRLAAIPLGTAGRPEDMVGAAVFLASADSGRVTGTVLYVDGGESVL